MLEHTQNLLGGVALDTVLHMCLSINTTFASEAPAPTSAIVTDCYSVGALLVSCFSGKGKQAEI